MYWSWYPWGVVMAVLMNVIAIFAGAIKNTILDPASNTESTAWRWFAPARAEKSTNCTEMLVSRAKIAVSDATKLAKALDLGYTTVMWVQLVAIARSTAARAH